MRSQSNPPIIIAGRGHYIHFTNLFNDSTQSVQLEYYPNDLKTFRTIPNNFNTELFTVATQIHNGNSRVNVIDRNRQIIKQIPISPALDVQVSDINSNEFLDIVYTYKNSSNEYSVFIIPDFHPYNSEKIEWPMYKHDLGKTCNYDFPDNFVPVELISFTFEVSEQAVLLRWTTATETNNSGFEILRGIYPANGGTQNDNEWLTLGFVPGFGTTTEPKSYSFTDEDVTTGIYIYRLKQIDFDGTFTYSNEIEVEVDYTPKKFVLYQNYPNPFNPTTTIKYALPVESQVRINIYNALGEIIEELVSKLQSPGNYEVTWSAQNYSSGIYYYSFEVNSADGSQSHREMKKIVFLK